MLRNRIGRYATVMSAYEGHERRRPDVTNSELIGGAERRDLELVAYDASWPSKFEVERARIANALGNFLLTIEHIGSTSVPKLAAKPVIDILVTVPDITAEEDYVEPLRTAGYKLRVREPGHRMVRTPTLDVHVHILEPDHPDVCSYLLFRERLRGDDRERELYAQTKRALIAHDWPDMNAYADAKTEVIKDIVSRACASDR